MNEDKWLDTALHIKENFEILKQGEEDVPEDEGLGSFKFIEFKGPLGMIRLEYITSPLVLGKKTLGSRRAGSDTSVEYQYSDTETVNKLKVYKHDEPSNEWVLMEMEHPEEMFF